MEEKKAAEARQGLFLFENLLLILWKMFGMIQLFCRVVFTSRLETAAQPKGRKSVRSSQEERDVGNVEEAPRCGNMTADPSDKWRQRGEEHEGERLQML